MAARWGCECVLTKARNTHLAICEMALVLLHQARLIPRDWYAMLRAFKPVWAEGLFDADHINPYGVNCSFASHFWAPPMPVRQRKSGAMLQPTAPGMNWLKQAWPSAKTEFARWDAESRGRADMQESLYYLGLALHYLTDLTQPHHANNLPVGEQVFHGIIPATFFHKTLESATMDWVAAAPEWKVRGDEAQLAQDLLPRAADIQARATQDVALQAAVDAVSNYTELMDTMAWIPVVGDAESAKPLVMKHVLPEAVVNTAAYILQWQRARAGAALPAVADRWTAARIMEFANSEAANNCAKWPELCAVGRPTAAQTVALDDNEHYMGLVKSALACPATLQEPACGQDADEYAAIDLQAEPQSAADCAQITTSVLYNECYTACDGLACTDSTKCAGFGCAPPDSRACAVDSDCAWNTVTLSCRGKDGGISDTHCRAYGPGLCTCDNPDPRAPQCMKDADCGFGALRSFSRNPAAGSHNCYKQGTESFCATPAAQCTSDAQCTGSLGSYCRSSTGASYKCSRGLLGCACSNTLPADVADYKPDAAKALVLSAGQRRQMFTPNGV